ncbi:MAG: hypothetical protein AAGJ97_07565 [Planctomycetota bacterium]
MIEVQCEAGDMIVVGDDEVARIVSVDDDAVVVSVRDPETADSWVELTFAVADSVEEAVTPSPAR